MPTTPDDATERLARILDLGTILLMGGLLSFRVYFDGQDVWDMPSAFVDVLAWFAFFLWAARCCVLGEVRVLWRWGMWLLPVYAVAVLLAYLRALPIGGMAAEGLMRHWGSDLILFFLMLHHCTTQERFRMMVTILVGTIGVVAAHALYQRWYGLAYFQHAMNLQDDLVTGTVGNDATMRALFEGRLQSTRAYGPYGYPNMLAGVMLLALPVWVVVARNGRAGVGWAARVLGGMGVLALLYSGSKAGFLVAKCAEWGVYAWSARQVGVEWRRAIWQAGSVMIMTTCATLGVAGVAWGLCAFMGISGMLPAQTVLGVLWWWVMLRVPGWFVSADGLEARVRRWAMVVTCVVVCICAWGLRGFPGGGQKLASYHDRALAAVEKNVGVRYNYWVAGWRMFSDAPLRGLGLDAYGQYYTHYKTVNGWAVRRAHNLYLQLATDGGLVLLLSWMATWGWIFTRRNQGACLIHEPLALEEKPGDMVRFYKLSVLALGGVVYLLVCSPVFSGLSVEFISAELSSSRISSWATNKWPGMIHLLAHVVFFPLAGVASGWAVWRWLDGEDAAQRVRGWLLAGCAIALLHLFFDFHYYMSVMSMLLWVFAGLATLATCRPGDWRTFRVSKRWQGVVGVVVMVAFFWFGKAVSMSGWEWATEASQASFLFQTREYEKALERYRHLVARRPDSPESHRRIVECLQVIAGGNIHAVIPLSSDGENVESALQVRASELSRMIRTDIREHLKMLLAVEPEYASNHAFASRVLMNFFPDDHAILMEAHAEILTAIRFYPLNAPYYQYAAELETILGMDDEAIRHLRDAIRVDAMVGDVRSKLSDETREMIRTTLTELDAPKS